MNKSTIKDLLTEKIDEIFIKIQDSEKIENGDISPLDGLAIDEKIDEISEIIARVIEYQKEGEKS